MKATCIVLDGVGAGALPDAEAYGDAGSDTLGHVAEAVGGLRVPNLGRLGLGNLHRILGVEPRRIPDACFGKLAERSQGKDSTTGHWELMGIVLDRPFPTYPDGFPDAITRAFSQAIGRDVIGNVAASGTEIINELGDAHVASGAPIVYTSADSVFQIAAHEQVVPVDELYRYCEIARGLLVGEHAVGRVIARPFTGGSGTYERTARRRDFSIVPPAPTLLDRLAARAVPVFGVGKVGELFSGRGFVEVVKTASNSEGIQTTLAFMRSVREGLIFVNLIEFDTAFGHRNDPEGFAGALETFDEAVPDLIGLTRDDDLLLITADHGNDPTTPSTDHSREHVPVLAYSRRGRMGTDLGTRESFADLGATLADYFRAQRPSFGRSFLEVLR